MAKNDTKNFLVALGVFLISLLAMAGSFGGWIYSQGAELASIKKDVSFQEKENGKLGRKLDSNSKELGSISGDVKATKKDIQYMNESLKDIKVLLKEIHKQNRRN